MTKTEAADIVTAALSAAGRYDQILSADAFAQRFAVALDALGLLDHCATPEQRAGNQIIDPASGAKAPSPDRIAEGVAWAAQRDRSR